MGEADPYLDALEEVATAAQALLESGIWHYRNGMPPMREIGGTNCFSVEGKFSRRLSDALMNVSRIPDASRFEDWETKVSALEYQGVGGDKVALVATDEDGSGW